MNTGRFRGLRTRAGLMLLIPVAATADIDLSGKAVQFYGELHGSIDRYHRGPPTAVVPVPAGLEITSNSSNFGFKGQVDVHPRVELLWRFETELDLSGETNLLEGRNRYLGLSTWAGRILIGSHNTPFKETGSRFTLFGDTIGDRTGIFGQTAAGEDRFNQRARSMAMYSVEMAGARASVLYSPDFSADTNPDTGDTGTSARLFSTAAGYRTGPVDLQLAAERQMAIGGVAGRNASGIRAGVALRFGAWQFGGLYEFLKDEGYGPEVERRAWGGHLAWTFQTFTVAGQYFRAGPSAASTRDGASLYAVRMQHSFNSAIDGYLVYAMLDNDVGASYQLARSGHGQAYAPTVAGAEVRATSVGLVYRF